MYSNSMVWSGPKLAYNKISPWQMNLKYLTYIIIRNTSVFEYLDIRIVFAK